MITEDLDEIMVKFFERSVEQNKATGEPVPFDVAVENVILEGGKFKDIRPIIAETKEQKTLSPPPPIITSINPTSGPATGGTHVNIIGDRFLPSCTVNFDGDPEAPGGTFTDPQHIMAVTPAHSAGFVDVEVENVSGLSDELVNAFEFIGPPTITSVSPPKGSRTGGSQVTINGNFYYTSGYTVTFDTTTVSATRLSLTQLRCTVPAHAGGASGATLVPVNIKVTASDSQTGTLVNGYSYYSGFVTILGPTVITQLIAANYTLEMLNDTGSGPDTTAILGTFLSAINNVGIASVGIGPNPIAVVGTGLFSLIVSLSGPGSGTLSITCDATLIPLTPLINIVINH